MKEGINMNENKENVVDSGLKLGFIFVFIIGFIIVFSLVTFITNKVTEMTEEPQSSSSDY